MVAAIQGRGWRTRTVLLVLLTCSVAFSDVVVREYNDGALPTLSSYEQGSPHLSLFTAGSFCARIIGCATAQLPLSQAPSTSTQINEQSIRKAAYVIG